MKSFVMAGSLLLAACSTRPATVSLSPIATGSAEAAAIPEGRTPEERRELFQAAVTLFDHGDGAAAEPLFLSIVDTYSALADHTQRHLARIAELREDRGAALDRWRALAENHPDSVWRAEAALALARAAAREGDPATAERWLEAARHGPADPPLLADTLWLSARTARARGDLDAARAFAVELRQRYPGSEPAREARQEAWTERRSVALARFEAARDEASRLLAEGDPARALELVGAALRRFRRDRDVATLSYLQALALKATGRADEAIAAFDRLRRRFPSRPEGGRALFRLATIAWNRDEDDRALELFDLYVRRQPRGEQAAESIYATGRIHQEAGRYAEAVRRFERLTRTYPKSSLAAEAGWRVGWCHYRGGDPVSAERAFARFAAGSTSERPAALYWRARSLERMNGAATAVYDEILLHFPESYYALLAERRTGRPEGSALTGKTALPLRPASFRPRDSTDPHLARFAELADLHLEGLARRELAAANPSSTGTVELLGAWLELGSYRESVSLAIRLGGCAPDSTFLAFCYPLAFWSAVRGGAERFALDPFLVLALIRQESRFDARAVSSADARGLMQLLPSTAARTAAAIGGSDDDVPDLFHPERNLELGTAHLRELLDRYAGNEPRALAAYNAGAAAVDRWQARYPGLDDDEFVDSISYRETRNYVKRVLQNRRIYRVLYGKGTASSPSLSGRIRTSG